MVKGVEMTTYLLTYVNRRDWARLTKLGSIGPSYLGGISWWYGFDHEPWGYFYFRLCGVELSFNLG
jgi:hypothetical protein